MGLGHIRKYERHNRYAASDRGHANGWVGYHAKQLRKRRKVR